MKLIIEHNMKHAFESVVQVDETTGSKRMFIEGVFLQANIRNRNGRIYPLEVMRNEVARYTTEVINTRRAFGELGHPDGPTINPERTAILIESLVQDGANFIGKAKLTSTPYGRIARGLIEDGGQLAVSSRGMASMTKENDADVIQDDFHLITAADIVTDPSAPDAFVNGIMEGRQWVWENGVFQPSALEAAKKLIHSTPKRKLDSMAIELFSAFLKQL